MKVRTHPFSAPRLALTRRSQTLALLGASFDCASKAEIQLALSQGATPERIVYANPCKALPELRFAKEAGVRMMTFDNAEELHKLKDHYADCASREK